MINYTEPKISKIEGSPLDNEIRYEHPSFGMLSFNRAHGGETELFGSSILHNNVVTMELTHADLDRGLNRDWYSQRNIIARVEMSYTQFAEAIASMGTTGVPVTLRYTEKDGRIPYCHFENKRTQITSELKENLHKNAEEARNMVSEIEKLFSSKQSISKKDREEIIKKLHKFVANIDCNSSYVFDQFNEQVDKTVSEAKGEVEAFVENKLRSVALEAMANNKELEKMDNQSLIEIFED